MGSSADHGSGIDRQVFDSESRPLRAGGRTDLEEPESTDSGFTSAQATARAAIQARDGGRHPWPAEEKVRIYHGVYLVPGADGLFEPLWGIATRFYFAFELGWGVSPVVWFEVQPSSGGMDPGSALLARGNRRLTVAAASSIDRADRSWHAGRLLVAFRRPIEDAALAMRLADLLPGSRSVGRLATNACYVSCPEFEEPASVAALLRAPDVQYAEKVMHAGPITAGGSWQLRALTD